MLLVVVGLLSVRHMGWMIFLHYMDFFGYLFRSLAQNEFLSDTFSARPKGKPWTISSSKCTRKLIITISCVDACSGPGTPTLGELYLTMFDIPLESGWKWGGIFFAIVAICCVVVMSYVAFERVRFGMRLLG